MVFDGELQAAVVRASDDVDRPAGEMASLSAPLFKSIRWYPMRTFVGPVGCR